MDDFRVLVTGDYWHSDFQELIRDNYNSTTLMPFECVFDTSITAMKFSLVVVAQSRRNQFDAGFMNRLLNTFPHVPVTALSGSWCEGEARSGSPVPGVVRVYWHQWQGRLDSFRRQLEHRMIATWNLPRTYSIADRVVRDLNASQLEFADGAMVGISALTPARHAMLKDVCDSAGVQSIWVDTIGDHEELEQKPQLILLEANSMSLHFVRRVRGLKEKFSKATFIATLNYPRRYDIDMANREGIEHVISKPFNLADLHLRMLQCLGQDVAA